MQTNTFSDLLKDLILITYDLNPTHTEIIKYLISEYLYYVSLK